MSGGGSLDAHRHHTRAVKQFLVTGANNNLADCKTVDHFDDIGESRAEGHGDPRGRTVGRNRVHERLVAVRKYRLVRDRDSIEPTTKYGEDVGRHPRPQFASGVVYPGHDARGSGPRVKNWIDRDDVASQCFPRIGNG